MTTQSVILISVSYKPDRDNKLKIMKLQALRNGKKKVYSNWLNLVKISVRNVAFCVLFSLTSFHRLFNPKAEIGTCDCIKVHLSCALWFAVCVNAVFGAVYPPFCGSSITFLAQ